MREEKRTELGKDLEVVFRERIRAFMVARGLKQWWLAEFSKLAQSTLSDLLSGRTSPTPQTVCKLAWTLGVKPKCLICPEDATVCPSCSDERRPPRVKLAM